MQPFLLHGGNSKKRRDWAVEVAKKNGWHYFEVGKGEIEKELFKLSITTSLDGKPNVIFIHSAEELTEKELGLVLKYAKDSPHRFILSSKALFKISKIWRDQCNPVRIGEPVPDEFFEALNQLMTNPDRESVREILAKNSAEVGSMLHILKNNVWKSQNPGVYKALESCMSLLYLVDDEFQVSMLAYLFPVGRIPLTYDHNRKLYISDTLMHKMRRKLRLNQQETIQTFNVIKDILANKPEFGFNFAKEFELDEKEKASLGIQEQVVQSTPISSIKASNLEKWF